MIESRQRSWRTFRLPKDAFLQYCMVNDQKLCQPSVESDILHAELSTSIQRAEVILVALLRKIQLWYALILSTFVDWLCLLPQQSTLALCLVEKLGVNLQLVVWSISGKDSKIKVRKSSSNLGGPRQVSLITYSQGDRIAGLVNGVPIPFQALQCRYPISCLY